MQGPNALDKMDPLRRSLDDLDLRLQIGKKQEVGPVCRRFTRGNSVRAITKIVRDQCLSLEMESMVL